MLCNSYIITLIIIHFICLQWFLIMFFSMFNIFLECQKGLIKIIKRQFIICYVIVTITLIIIHFICLQWFLIWFFSMFNIYLECQKKN